MTALLCLLLSKVSTEIIAAKRASCQHKTDNEENHVFYFVVVFHFWIRNCSHIATHFVLVVDGLVLRHFKSDVGIKFSRIVLQLMESDFWYDIKISRRWYWCHFMHISAFVQLATNHLRMFTGRESQANTMNGFGSLIETFDSVSHDAQCKYAVILIIVKSWQA